MHNLFKVTNLDTGELFIGPDGVGEGGLVGVPGVLLQGVLLLQQHNLLHLLIWDSVGIGQGQRGTPDFKIFKLLWQITGTGYRRRSYGRLGMLQRQDTRTGYSGRSKG